MLRKVLWIGLSLVCLLVVAAILYPMLAQARKYSGPGLFRDALLMGLDGQPAKNRVVTLYLGGRGKVQTKASDDLGIVHVDDGLDVDGVDGFQRMWPTVDSKGYYHPVFWEDDPATPTYANNPYLATHSKGGKAIVSWPTEQSPNVKIIKLPFHANANTIGNDVIVRKP